MILNVTHVKEYHFKVNNNMESALRRVQIHDKRWRDMNTELMEARKGDRRIHQ